MESCDAHYGGSEEQNAAKRAGDVTRVVFAASQIPHPIVRINGYWMKSFDMRCHVIAITRRTEHNENTINMCCRRQLTTTEAPRWVMLKFYEWRKVFACYHHHHECLMKPPTPPEQHRPELIRLITSINSRTTSHDWRLKKRLPDKNA